MKSIFKPLIEEGLTTLKIRYSWKTDECKMEALKEWEYDQGFSGYNHEFYGEEILTDDVKYLNTKQVRKLYHKYEMGEYLEHILMLIKQGKHFGMECYYNAKLGIKIISHQHSRKMGLNNRRHAIFLDGIRRYDPEYDEMDMIKDGLNISRRMSFKLRAGNLDFGGSKTMVQMPPMDLTNLEEIGYIAYIFDKCRCMTGADMNVPTALADVMNEHFSMSFTSGPKSPLGETGKPTAYGVFETLKKAVLFKEGTEDLSGKKAVLMGLGAVGWYMGEHLLDSGVKLYIADISDNRMNEFIEKHPEYSIEKCNVEDAIFLDVDIVSPCAVGNLITRENIDNIKCKYIWGSANGQIKADTPEEEIEIAKLLEEKNIMFQTEWWHNTGGVICAAQEYLEGTAATYEKLIKYMDDNLPEATWNNLSQARKLGITPTENAYRVCTEYIYG